MSILIIDYEMGNLGSVRSAFENCGSTHRVIVSKDPAAAREAEWLVLPGVGSFADGMKNLTRSGWDHAIREAVGTRKIPLLGICLGMQLLADHGDEGGSSDGLGLIRGTVTRLMPKDAGERIPHIGWNEVRWEKRSPLSENTTDVKDLYFVHSYHLVPKDPADIAATTPYCGRFVSAVSRENVHGVQFHPEKSQRAGFKIIESFLAVRQYA